MNQSEKIATAMSGNKRKESWREREREPKKKDRGERKKKKNLDSGALFSPK
jgi:hypothetical protein